MPLLSIADPRDVPMESQPNDDSLCNISGETYTQSRSMLLYYVL